MTDDPLIGLSHVVAALLAARDRMKIEKESLSYIRDNDPDNDPSEDFDAGYIVGMDYGIIRINAAIAILKKETGT